MFVLRGAYNAVEKYCEQAKETDMKAETNEKRELHAADGQMMQQTAATCPLPESGGEFVLPDYLPKVQRVLRLEANALPPTPFVRAGEVQMSGSVLHTLIYLGEDGEMGATVLPTKYEFAVPTGKAAHPTVDAVVQVDSVSYRLSAPRKINIRTRLAAKPQVYSTVAVAPLCTPAEIDGLHRLEETVDGVDTRFVRLPDTELSDSIDVAGAAVRPIWCGSTAAVTDVRVTPDGAILRGDVYVKVLAVGGDAPRMLRKKLPFEARLDAESEKGTVVTACAAVLSTEAGREPESGNIYVECVIALTCRIDTPRRISVVTDAFSTQADGTVEMQKLPTRRLCFARTGVYGAGGSLPLAELGLSGADSVLDASGRITVEEVQAADGRVTVAGRCILQVICHTEDGFTAGEGSMPIRLTVDAETPRGMSVSAVAQLAELRTRIDGETLICDADAALTLCGTADGTCDAVCRIDFTAAKPIEKSRYPLAVIYPCGDSLWTLAKENHTDPARLAALNQLAIEPAAWHSPTAMAGRHALILECKQ